MRYWKQITAFTLFSFFAQGQSVTYKVIKDTPDDFANYWVNVGILDLNYSQKNPGSTTVGFSLNTVVHYKNKFGGELTFKKYYFSLAENAPSGSHFEVGGFFNFATKQSSKNQKVILREKGKGYSEVSMKIPATMQRAFGVRAGFNSHSVGLDALTTNYKDLTSDIIGGTASSAGFYAGILMTSSLNMRSHTVEYGIKNTGFVRRNYLDVLINPINKVLDANGAEITTMKTGAIGFRLGVEFMKAEPKKMTGSAKYQKLEIGSRPIDGYYALYTIGFNFKRKVKSMSSFKVVREKE